MDNLNFDKEKRPKKLPKNKRMPDDPDATKRRSTLAIRLFLKEFCVEFLHAGVFVLLCPKPSPAIIHIWAYLLQGRAI